MREVYIEGTELRDFSEVSAHRNRRTALTELAFPMLLLSYSDGKCTRFKIYPFCEHWKTRFAQTNYWADFARSQAMLPISSLKGVRLLVSKASCSQLCDWANLRLNVRSFPAARCIPDPRSLLRCLAHLLCPVPNRTSNATTERRSNASALVRP